MADLVTQLLYSAVEFGPAHPGHVHGVLDDGVNVPIEVRANIVAMIRSKASSCLHAWLHAIQQQKTILFLSNITEPTVNQK